MKTLAAPTFALLRRALAEEIRSIRARDALAPVLVVTRSDLDREETRRDLATRLGGTAGVRCLSIAEWVREIAAPAIHRAGGRRISSTAFERIVARHARESIPGVSRLYAETIRDLEQARILPEHLTQVLAGSTDPLQTELARLFSETHRVMEETKRFDDPRGEERARAILQERAAAVSPPPPEQERAARSGAPSDAVFFFGFHDMTALQRTLVEAADRAHPATLMIPGPGGVGDGAAAALLTWARARGETRILDDGSEPALLTLDESMFGSSRIVVRDPERVEMSTGLDDAAEVRHIARTIRDENTANGRAFDEFLIVVPLEGPSPRLVRRLFARAGIPLEDRAGVFAPRTFEGRRAIVLARGLLARGGEDAAGALSFLTLGPEPLERPVEEDPHTRFLRGRDAGEIIEAYRVCHRERFESDPPREVEEALEAIREAQGDAPFRPRDFPRELATALSGIRNRGEGSAGTASVLLVRHDQARGLRRPVVFFPGLVAGALTRAPRQDPLLPDVVREALNERHERDGRVLALKVHGAQDEALLLRFALECAEERAILSWSPRACTGGPPRLPARLFVDLASERAGHPLDPGGRELLEQAPYEAIDDALERPLDLGDLELAFLREAPRVGEDALARLFAEDGGQFLDSAVEATRARWSRRRLTPHDGVLASEPARVAVRDALKSEARAWSASSLERLLACPYKFLVQQVLRLDPPRIFEDDLDPLERGRFVHDVLESVLSALHDEQRLPLTPAVLPRALQLLDREMAVLRADVARMPPAVRVAQSPALATMHREIAGFFAREAHAPLEGRATPRYFELQFAARAPRGPDPQLSLFSEDEPGAARAAPADPLPPPVRFTLPSGREIPLRGKIDRVDLREDGALEIVDYKSGRIPKSSALVVRSSERTQVHLQLPLYAYAASILLGKPVERARYVATAARENARVVDVPGVELRGSLEEVGRLVERALECVERGWFPSIPGDACCTGDLRCACGPLIASRMRVKRGDAQLERHLEILGVSLQEEDE